MLPAYYNISHMFASAANGHICLYSSEAGQAVCTVSQQRRNIVDKIGGLLARRRKHERKQIKLDVASNGVTCHRLCVLPIFARSEVRPAGAQLMG